MKVAIASGKGGTGKTLIATNLAHVANADLVDLDVEEPNCSIFFPEAKFVSKREVSRSVPEIDLGRCTFCRKCAESCEFQSIAVLKDKVLVFEEMCHDCGACYFFCPEDAINKKDHTVGMIYRLALENNRELVYGELRIGEASSIPLIKEIKMEMSDNGLTIIDCPPGTSCPPVESIRDADFCLLVTEPTPFGLHDLRLALRMVRKLRVKSAVFINKHGIKGTDVESFCKSENIQIIARLPFDRSIAEDYSKGLKLTNRKEYKAILKDTIHRIEEEVGSH